MRRALTGGNYSLHPLSALDGVLIYVTLNGETVGYFFGSSEQSAAEAVAAEIAQHAEDRSGGAA